MTTAAPQHLGPHLGTWSLALTTSLAAHLGSAALVIALLHRPPAPDQPPPQSTIRIETQEVARSKATPEQPNSPNAAAAPTKGTTAAEGVVPASKAVAEAPKAQALTATTAPAEPSKATLPPAQKLAATAPPPPSKATPAPAEKLIAAAGPTPTKAATAPAEKLAAATAPITTATAALPAATPLQASTTQADILTPTTAPAASLPAVTTPAPLAKATAATAPTLAATTAQGTTLASTEPDTPPLPEAPPNLQPAAAAPSGGDHVTAALAWTGADAQIDPASLKAIQSFMQPGDTKAQADETHDALSAILSSVPCSRLQAEFNPATGSLDLRGHVPDPAMKGPVLKALQDQLGTGIKVNDAMLILPRPQCGALSGIADVGLPQSQDQNTNPKLIGDDAQARAYDYTRGQTMVLDLAAPDYDAYVYVDYFAADGSVIHLIPNDTVHLKLRTAKSALRVGAPDAGEPFLNITIGPPYGQEIAAAFAASAPLYDGTRPLSEPAAPYLDWLKTRVTEARAKDPGFKGEWVYFFVSTKDQ